MGVRLNGIGSPRGVCPLDYNGKIPQQYLSLNAGPDSFMNNADKDCPAEVYFNVSAAPSSVLLTCWSRSFRAYAKSIPSGGGKTSGNASAKHQHTVTVAAHKHDLNYDFTHDHGVNVADGAGGYPLCLDGTGQTTTLKSNKGTGTSNQFYTVETGISGVATSEDGGSSTPTSSEGGDVHTHDVPNHDHEITFGIYEYKVLGVRKYAACQLFLNDPGCTTPVGLFGVRGSKDATFIVQDMDLASLYVAGAPGVGTIGDGNNSAYILPAANADNASGLLRIAASVKVNL